MIRMAEGGQGPAPLEAAQHKATLFCHHRLKFEPKLLNGSCASHGYTVYKSTERDGVPPLAVTNDRYVKPSE